jgi:hypothetical protein
MFGRVVGIGGNRAAFGNTLERAAVGATGKEGPQSAPLEIALP